MAIIQLPLPIAVNTGVSPNIKTMTTTDSYATITAAGYLNSGNLQGYPVGPQDVLHIIYNFNINTKVGIFGIFTVTVSNGIITLTEDQTTNEVTYDPPSVVNYFATWQNTIGNLKIGEGLSINAGDIQAGTNSGTNGGFISYSSTPNKGSLRLSAAPNTGNTVTTINNAAMGQASIVTIPDPAAATANFVVAPTALVNNQLVKASGTSGLVVDCGFSLIVQTTAPWAGGVLVFGFAAPGLTSSSKVVASILTSSNNVSITGVTPSTNLLTIDFSADPGANTTITYIATSGPV